MRKLFLLGILLSLVSCTRTPERILSKTWGVNVKGLEYSVTSFKDQWNGNGDGETEIKMAVELPQKDIDNLISHGAKPLPIVGPENEKRWLERISGIDCAADGVYFGSVKPFGLRSKCSLVRLSFSSRYMCSVDL